MGLPGREVNDGEGILLAEKLKNGFFHINRPYGCLTSALQGYFRLKGDVYLWGWT